MEPDQLVSQKPADLALHCFHNRLYQDLAWFGLNWVMPSKSCKKICLLSGLFRSLTLDDETSRTGVVVMDVAVIAMLLELPKLVGDIAEKNTLS